MTQTTITRPNLDKAPIPVRHLLPQTARELLLTAASTTDSKTRANAIDTTTDLIRKTWPEYFSKNP